jgi:hypothetical protein
MSENPKKVARAMDQIVLRKLALAGPLGRSCLMSHGADK